MITTLIIVSRVGGELKKDQGPKGCRARERERERGLVVNVEVKEDEMGRVCCLQWRRGIHIGFWWEKITGET
jgi:hypothetical protein